MIGDGGILIGHSMGGELALRIAVARSRSFRAMVLTGCFFPPARNGRTTRASLADYGRHRVAFVRAMRGRTAASGPRESSVPALASLVRRALSSQRTDAAIDALEVPALVVHARDDHHVPFDFAVAAANRRPGWSLALLASGGHHCHVDDPDGWLAAVVPWLRAQTPPDA